MAWRRAGASDSRFHVQKLFFTRATVHRPAPAERVQVLSSPAFGPFSLTLSHTFPAPWPMSLFSGR